jgi:hypothetical protein
MMATVLIRAGEAALRAPSPGLFATLAHRLAERVTLPHRDLAPEWFRFPLP